MSQDRFNGNNVVSYLANFFLCLHIYSLFQNEHPYRQI
jgi:hypothetical protein